MVVVEASSMTVSRFEEELRREKFVLFVVVSC